MTTRAVAQLFALPFAVSFALLCSRALSAGESKTIGVFGPGAGNTAVIDLVYGNGSTATGNGSSVRASQFLLRFEGGGYFKSTAIGNLAGIEGGFEMGYDGLRAGSGAPAADFMGDFGMAADVWLGFPVTLANYGDGKADWLRLSVAPGLGTSLQYGYFYLRSALAVQIPGAGGAELVAHWWPDEATHAYGRTAVTTNTAALKLAYYHDKRMHFFVQYRRSQTVYERALVTDDPTIYSGLSGAPGSKPFVREERQDGESVFTVGIGFTPFTVK